MIASTLSEVFEIREGEHVLRRSFPELCALFLVLAQDPDGVGMLDDVGNVLRRAVHVDGRAHGSDERQREVEQRPLEPRRREDREGVALADAEGEQPVCELLDGLRRLLPGHLAPSAVLFDQVCRDRPVSRAGVLPEARDRVRSRETGFRGRFSLNRHPSES